MIHPLEGQIWLADLDPTVANEQSGIRPVLVVSTNTYNRWPIRHAIIAPITTRDRGLAHHVEVVGSGLDHASFAMPEGARAVSTKRFKRLLGQVEPDTLGLVRFHVRQFLGQRPVP